MNKFLSRLLLVAMGFIVLCASPSMAIFPKPDYYELYTLRQGYYDDQQAWFISTTTNSIGLASSTFWSQLWNPFFEYPPVLSGQLTSALDSTPKTARPVYLVTNFNQGPVFDTAPGMPDYSGLWQIYLVTWKTDAPRIIKNTQPFSELNPYALPCLTEAEIVETDIVVDLPLMAIGEIGGPWQSAPSGGYRIKQALDYDPASIQKWILLPHYYVFANDSITKQKLMVDVLITDSDNEDIANLLGANYAPRLSQMPDSDVRAFWAFNQPSPPGQQPVVQESPTGGRLNSNPDYSPVMDLTYLDRNIPGYVVVNNRFLVEKLIPGGLTPTSTYRINTNAVIETALW